MYNKAQLIGHIGQAPESRQLDSGVTVTKISIATNESYKNKSGEKVTQTEWHNIECWRGMAETITKYCKKGDLILIEGKIKTDSYEKNGEKRYSTKIVADSFKFMPGAKKEGVASGPTGSAEAESDDLPF